MADALLGDGPTPPELRAFLLATGERGLGWATVAQLSAAQFERLWLYQQQTLLMGTEDGPHKVRVARALSVATTEAAPPPPLPVIDPETATPEQIAAYRAALRTRGT